MTDKTEFQPPLSTLGVDSMSPSELEELQFETRRRAAWNRRASLLRALQLQPGEELRVFIQDSIDSLERAFQNHRWETDGDNRAKLDPITPVPSAAEVAALAKANNAAAQRAAMVANVTGWIELAGTFLNIANGRVPALDQADEAAMSAADQSNTFAMSSVDRANEAAMSSDEPRVPSPRPTGVGMVVGPMLIGALIGGLIVFALMKGN